ncbi:hypothetical protein TBLA_0F03710 [Henningerozyma blattae CBS 6284]|uniref:Uncharacterized protein n=1 Tax=Henningerozyma blattae (strain ATCC 34711 / CBS 6284 / DSM 70876 / NBRC 10599 / NRRL Y-10934 / UCD 77-7) TaxID=1071380 RepID=I2H6A5_HENB6|nr:hypothetical protein TBLA_0F03710 [Tetrapisispora blattae CBS 6284]CCH61907.1 hypothetical protein TBLA_0F03710 [Tetrapisispora blattae CBS 6284]
MYATNQHLSPSVKRSNSRNSISNSSMLSNSSSFNNIPRSNSTNDLFELTSHNTNHFHYHSHLNASNRRNSLRSQTTMTKSYSHSNLNLNLNSNPKHSTPLHSNKSINLNTYPTPKKNSTSINSPISNNSNNSNTLMQNMVPSPSPSSLSNTHSLLTIPEQLFLNSTPSPQKRNKNLLIRSMINSNNSFTPPPPRLPLSASSSTTNLTTTIEGVTTSPIKHKGLRKSASLQQLRLSTLNPSASVSNYSNLPYCHIPTLPNTNPNTMRKNNNRLTSMPRSYSTNSISSNVPISRSNSITSAYSRQSVSQNNNNNNNNNNMINQSRIPRNLNSSSMSQPHMIRNNSITSSVTPPSATTRNNKTTVPVQSRISRTNSNTPLESSSSSSHISRNNTPTPLNSSSKNDNNLTAQLDAFRITRNNSITPSESAEGAKNTKLSPITSSRVSRSNNTTPVQKFFSKNETSSQLSLSRSADNTPVKSSNLNKISTSPTTTSEKPIYTPIDNFLTPVVSENNKDLNSYRFIQNRNLMNRSNSMTLPNSQPTQKQKTYFNKKNYIYQNHMNKLTPYQLQRIKMQHAFKFPNGENYTPRKQQQQYMHLSQQSLVFNNSINADADISNHSIRPLSTPVSSPVIPSTNDISFKPLNLSESSRKFKNDSSDESQASSTLHDVDSLTNNSNFKLNDDDVVGSTTPTTINSTVKVIPKDEYIIKNNIDNKRPLTRSNSKLGSFFRKFLKNDETNNEVISQTTKKTDSTSPVKSRQRKLINSIRHNSTIDLFKNNMSSTNDKDANESDTDHSINFDDEFTRLGEYIDKQTLLLDIDSDNLNTTTNTTIESFHTAFESVNISSHTIESSLAPPQRSTLRPKITNSKLASEYYHSKSFESQESDISIESEGSINNNSDITRSNSCDTSNSSDNNNNLSADNLNSSPVKKLRFNTKVDVRKTWSPLEYIRSDNSKRCAFNNNKEYIFENANHTSDSIDEVDEENHAADDSNNHIVAPTPVIPVRHPRVNLPRSHHDHNNMKKAIKLEINSYKMNEMVVHKDSHQNTHFLI